ncbi:hypothetical protein F5Y17DRAFT_107406 [Xylariaceae sp. FL0594]|nr:hypothetical protein F5Y17DRAFT_107406 [Xylariaceae sp. FL0594]
MSSTTPFPQQPRPFFPSPPSPSYIAGYPKHYFSPCVERGLQTPPTERDMRTAYHRPVAGGNTYNNHLALARQPKATVPAPRDTGDNRGCNVCSNARTRLHSYAQPPPRVPVPPSHAQPDTGPTSAQSPSTSVASSQLSSRGVEEQLSERDSVMVTHSLELPKCIDPNGGRLDEFAALMTCFFWFESMDVIQAAEQIFERRSYDLLPPLSKHTEPQEAYKKWVNNVLTTTQITQNVVLLALLFIYKLKKTNPRVHGNPGSEYRLLTVALMLGNKFLDDNTYTNKTWAEVSGLAVKEIHVMEVEFLSNMRYGLLCSKEEYEQWLKKLACYREYCERARADEAVRQARNGPIQLPSNHIKINTPLPSPTAAAPSSLQNTPSFAAAYTPASAPNPTWDSSYQPLTVQPNVRQPLARKRNYEGEALLEPAPKRVSRAPVKAAVHAMRPVPSGPESVRLPAPQLTLDTSQATLPPYGAACYPPQPAVSLPPLNQGFRAMSTVYSTPTSSWPAQGAVLPTAGPGPQPSAYVVHSNYGTPTKTRSPSMMPTLGSSPLAEVYSSHTPLANSPSAYLQQRASPYKPVRRVNTLLNPPPSIPLSEYHLGSSQMHYQPLGRRNELRTGIVPEYLPTYAPQRTQVPQMNQMAPTPFHHPPPDSDPAYIRASPAPRGFP